MPCTTLTFSSTYFLLAVVDGLVEEEEEEEDVDDPFPLSLLLAEDDDTCTVSLVSAPPGSLLADSISSSIALADAAVAAGEEALLTSKLSFNLANKVALTPLVGKERCDSSFFKWATVSLVRLQHKSVCVA